MRNITATLFDILQDNPSVAAGLCIFAVGFSLVAGNAVYGQAGPHPDPIWATRDQTVTSSIDAKLASLEADEDVPASASKVVPVSRSARVKATLATDAQAAVEGEKAALEAERIALVREVQSLLSAQGLYTGTIDGLYGPRTREAISKFQQSAGLTADGAVSPSLITELAKSVAAAKSDGKAGQKVASVSESKLAPRKVKTETILAEEVSKAKPAKTASVPLDASVEEVNRAAAIARIQIGLINAGKNAVSVDGVLGPQTAAAIREFQKQHKLPVTGEPDDMVIRLLEKTGALRQG